jgi:hypothetical protein
VNILDIRNENTVSIKINRVFTYTNLSTGDAGKSKWRGLRKPAEENVKRLS